MFFLVEVLRYMYSLFMTYVVRHSRTFRNKPFLQSRKLFLKHTRKVQNSRYNYYISLKKDLYISRNIYEYVLKYLFYISRKRSLDISLDQDILIYH